MKKLLFAALLPLSCFIFSAARSQGNLQFNQVILYDLAASGVQAISVPAGKVWKVESAGSYNGSNTGIVVRNAAAQAITILATSANSGSVNFPYWIPSGFTGSFLNGTSGGRASVTIIEFNVVP